MTISSRSIRSSTEVTWSKVQNSSGTIHETQGYVALRIGDLAEKLEKKTKVDDLAKTAKEAEADVQKWLAVLARCLQLRDAIAVLELDRVLDASPDELDRHRLGLKAARRDRLEPITKSTEHLLMRMIAAVSTANSKVLFNPIQSPAVVKSGNRVAIHVHDFHDLLGIASGDQSSEAAKWKDAAAERWDKTRETGAGGIDAARRFSTETRDHATSAKDKLSGRIARRKHRRSEDGEERDDEAE